MRQLALLIFLLFCVCTTYGQEEGKWTTWRLGYHLSPALSWMTTDSDSIRSNGVKWGFKMGLIAEKYFDKNYAISSGANIVFGYGGTLNHARGGLIFPDSEFEDDTLRYIPNNTDVRYSFQAIEIPVGIKLRSDEIGYMRYYVNMPFLFHFRTKALGTYLSQEKVGVTRDVNFMNVSWGFGGGFEYSIANYTALNIGVYFHNGLIDTTANRDTRLYDTNGNLTDKQENSKAIINGLTFRVGMLF